MLHILWVCVYLICAQKVERKQELFEYKFHYKWRCWYEMIQNGNVSNCKSKNNIVVWCMKHLRILLTLFGSFWPYLNGPRYFGAFHKIQNNQKRWVYKFWMEKKLFDKNMYMEEMVFLQMLMSLLRHKHTMALETVFF